MYAFLIGGMVILLSGAIVLSLANDIQIEYELNNGTASSGRKGTNSPYN